LATSSPQTETSALQRILWSVLTAILGAIATIAARRTAQTIWKLTTGEQPPKKK
jgi:hypothetical protein